MRKLFVIAGHGAGDSGAVGYGYTEAERVRALAKKVKELGGNNVMLGDVNRNYYRDNGISKLTISKEWSICELHMDSGSSKARGGHVIIKEGTKPNTYDTGLAKMISTMFTGRSQTLVGRSDLANCNRAYAKGYDYRLMECGFISNRQDLDIFNSHLETLARNILNVYGIPTTVKAEGWKKNVTGWWWQESDGTYPRNKWKYINNVWYFFNEYGYMLSNTWKYDKGANRYFYFDRNGHAIEGWQYVNKHWYFFNTRQGIAGHEEARQTCEMLRGWKSVNGNWYYFGSHPDGAMLTGCQEINKKEYYFSTDDDNIKLPTGAMLTGWRSFHLSKENKTGWAYYDVNGHRLFNQWTDDKKYFIKDNGVMASDEELKIGSETYKFDCLGHFTKVG